MIHCRLTGQIVQSPVITPCKHIFEHSAIINHLKTSSKCPVCGKEINESNLKTIEVQQIVHPSPVITGMSFGGLLESLYKEYEDMLKEKHELKMKISMTEKELACALYENEASKRVIAKLLKEKKSVENQSN